MMISQAPNLSEVMDRLYGAGMARFASGLLVAAPADPAGPAGTDAHHGWDPAAEPIHAGPGHLHISVRRAEAGPVAVVCVEGPYVPDGLTRLFRGELVLPGETLSLHDPDGEIDLRLPVTGKRQTVEVYGDAPAEPSHLWLVLTTTPHTPGD